MPGALTPELALDYLAELSTDIRAAVVLSPTGELLAGQEDLAAPARELLAAAGPDAAGAEVQTGAGTVFAARSAEHALVVLAGRFALASLVRFDLRLALGDLATS